MLNEPKSQGARSEHPAECRLERLLCRRTGERIALAEHAQCPYCFGREGELETGRHERFCDFVPGRDPVHFGFPPGTSRELSG